MFEITYDDSHVLQNFIDANKVYHGAIYDFTFEERFIVYHFFVKDTARYIALDSITGYGSEITRRRKEKLFDSRSYHSMTPMILNSIKYTDDKRYLNVIINRPLDVIKTIFLTILPEYGFVVREEQIKLSQNMYLGLTGKQVAICEAEVGAGKTLAYLIASFVAKERYTAEYGFSLPVTISTSSIELQKMIVEKEVPQLSRMLQDYGLIKHPLSAVVRKGKEHYFCKARCYDYLNKLMEHMFYASGTHNPIIDRETFEKVQALLQNRKERFSKSEQQNIYPLTSRIRCSECGSYYHRRVRNGTIKWVCAKHNTDTHACPSGYYSEERIYDGFITMVNKLRFGEERILDQVIVKLETAATRYKRNNASAGEKSRSIAELNAKLAMLEQLRSKGYLAIEVYQSQARDIQKQISTLKAERRSAFESTIQTMLGEVLKMRSLFNEIEEPLEEFDDKLFLELVKDVEINKQDEMAVTFLGGLKFTELI